MTSKSTGRHISLALAAGAAVIAFGISSDADAYEAYVASPSPLLSGPSPDYPPVVDFNGGEPVTVYGCLDGYDWCDVSFEGYRGWFDGNLLNYPYEGQRVPLFEYGYQIGVPVIGFSFDDYWGRYYHDRPFYRDRERWARVPPPQARPHVNGPAGFGPNRGPGPGGYPGPRPEFGQRPEPGQRPEFEHGPGPQQMQRGPEAQRPQPQAQRPPQAPQAQPQNRQVPPQGQQAPHPQAQPRPQQAQPPRPQAAPAPHPQAAPPAPKPAAAPHPEEHRPEEGPH